MTDYSKLIAGAEAQGVLDDLEADLLAALKVVMAERDSFRAVLEGARYGNIDGIAKNEPEFSHKLGEAALRAKAKENDNA